jgi:hypothetical protein
MPNRRNVPAFGSFRYRNLVGRFYHKLKHFRAVAAGYDKTPERYLPSVKLASVRIWMRADESMTECGPPMRAPPAVPGTLGHLRGSALVRPPGGLGSGR